MIDIDTDADTVRRAARIGVGLAFACWIATILSLSYLVFVAGLSPTQQRAAERFVHQPVDALGEPVVALMAGAIAFGVCAVCAISYYGYAQWRAAKRRLRALERESESEPDGEADDESDGESEPRFEAGD